MPRSMKMAEIKSILQIKESNRDFSNRQILAEIENSDNENEDVIDEESSEE